MISQQKYCSREAKKHLRMFLGTIFLLAIITPISVSAHEVYVLNHSEINQAIDEPSFSLWDTAIDNLDEFGFWAFVGILSVIGIFFISTLRFLERRLDPMFLHLRKYATLIARVTVGLSFLAAAYYQALYGPELPLSAEFGSWASFATVLLIITGVMVVVGYRVRLAAVIALVMFSLEVCVHGIYMLTYVNYLGEILVLLIVGAHSFSLEGKWKIHPHHPINIHTSKLIVLSWKHIHDYLVPRSFAILRVLFGVALIYASLYAKVLHNNLALLTVEQYHLDKLLGFEPHFLVLGAAIVEFLIGLFFILGIEIRFTALFMLFWLTLSLIFFGEVVWPHLILIGIPIAYIFYGYDDYSLEGYLFRKKKYGPVL